MENNILLGIFFIAIGIGLDHVVYVYLSYLTRTLIENPTRIIDFYELKDLISCFQTIR